MTSNKQRRQRQGFSRLFTVTLIVTIGVTVAASGASAQTTPQVDVSVGYLNVAGTMHGWYFQPSVEVGPHWGLVAEFDKSSGPDSGCARQR